MARPRDRVKGRKESGPVMLIPHAVMNHPDYLKLSGKALRLLFELAKQYNGYTNNGDLTAAWTVMKGRGFGSEETLSKAVNLLMELGFIIRTREGRFMNPGRRCALYAVAWKPINECIGKDLEVGPTDRAPRSFTADIIKMPTTETVAIGYGNWSDGRNKRALS